jgi:hypothetical protein
MDHAEMQPPLERKILDSQSEASHPARLRLSESKLRRVRPDLFGVRGLGWRFIRLYFGSGAPRFDPRRFIEEQLWYGDARAAVVVSATPLRVAAYCDEMDCVAMLQLPQRLAAELNLADGARLVTANTYTSGWSPGRSDLIPGMYHSGQFTGFYPLLADLATDDRERLAALKREIPEAEWRRTQELGRAYLAARPKEYRNGLPAKSEFSAGAGREAIVAMIFVVIAVIAAIGLVLRFT